jgi:hypothetical protein
MQLKDTQISGKISFKQIARHSKGTKPIGRKSFFGLLNALSEKSFAVVLF